MAVPMHMVDFFKSREHGRSKMKNIVILFSFMSSDIKYLQFSLFVDSVNMSSCQEERDLK